MNNYKNSLIAFLLIYVAMTFSACPLFRATGDSVEAVGEGTGHAISGTGRAISDAAH